MEAEGKTFYHGGGTGNGLGVGQTWIDVAGSRSCGTDYINNTGAPIKVIVRGIGHGNGLTMEVDGVNLPLSSGYSNPTNQTGDVVVPDGSTYRLSCASLYSIYEWVELR